MEELHRTHKPVEFGWLKALNERTAARRRRSTRASLLSGGHHRAAPGLY